MKDPMMPGALEDARAEMACRWQLSGTAAPINPVAAHITPAPALALTCSGALMQAQVPGGRL
jgi:hypothetical protein